MSDSAPSLGAGDVQTLIVADEAHTKAMARYRKADEDRRAKDEAAYEEAQLRRALDMKVQCTFCGSEFGKVCRATGKGPGRLHTRRVAR
ncbi:hypothetical protein GCM10023317_11970 [Actinopolymorpha pittospori]|uniref:Phosphoribosylaminoimidazole-succinocarboxamide synthase n=1 Tax=Actinopolymorpha pittospori TaxID=648752 RepID=A0A927MYL5_9ACTN|nr:phosphoribosylaminoimidazole-succinocarboxamide synthase [Actinopolymorpha pittospori]